MPFIFIHFVYAKMVQNIFYMPMGLNTCVWSRVSKSFNYILVIIYISHLLPEDYNLYPRYLKFENLTISSGENIVI